MIKKLGFLLFGFLAFSCGDSPEIAKNRNPFPNNASPTTGVTERFALNRWSWEGVPRGTEDDPEDQEEAEAIFQGVEINFFYDPLVNHGITTFEYKNKDGRMLTGTWDFDMSDSILSMTFDEDWDSPILTRGKTALFDVHQITETILEMRFTELPESKNAILIFVHKG